MGSSKDNNSNDYNTLVEFLEYPLGSADSVFQRFNSIPNSAKMLRGKSPDRFLYLPGVRENKVLLVAHADTVWDRENHHHNVVRTSDILHSSNPDVGLGADDRAGCAIIWLLREFGHSILITDGEERGRLGSRFLMSEYKTVADEIQNDHQFVIQFDLYGKNSFKCYNVGSEAFRNYIRSEIGFMEFDRSSWSDIVTLCEEIVGVNLGIGYQNAHSSSECLYLDDWYNTLNVCRNWLSQEYLLQFVL